MLTRVLNAAMTQQWAITEQGLHTILSVAARENAASITALEAYRARHVPTAERLAMRGTVATLDITGPMFRYANVMTSVSGASSYDVIRRDLQVALDDPAVTAILLKIDSPGGEVSGADELAKAIRNGKSKKPIFAYVGNMAASAAYWLASQASEIVISETAMLGSIGVRAGYQDTSKADVAAGKVEFISSQSPNKRTDLSSDHGRARIQRTIDALADVFIATVAAGRGVTPDQVQSKFGGGDVLIGAAAVAAGMADRLGNFEGLVAELRGRKPGAAVALSPRATAAFVSGVTVYSAMQAEEVLKVPKQAELTKAMWKNVTDKINARIGPNGKADRPKDFDPAAGTDR